MNDPVKPTAEGINAAFSAYIADDQPDKSNYDDFKLFMKMMDSSKRLRAEMEKAVREIANLEVPDSYPGMPQAEILKMDVSLICNVFFWIGWHTRGAVVDAAQLQRMSAQ